MLIVKNRVQCASTRRLGSPNLEASPENSALHLKYYIRPLKQTTLEIVKFTSRKLHLENRSKWNAILSAYIVGSGCYIMMRCDHAAEFSLCLPMTRIQSAVQYSQNDIASTVIHLSWWGRKYSLCWIMSSMPCSLHVQTKTQSQCDSPLRQTSRNHRVQGNLILVGVTRKFRRPAGLSQVWGE